MLLVCENFSRLIPETKDMKLDQIGVTNFNSVQNIFFSEDMPIIY